MHRLSTDYSRKRNCLMKTLPDYREIETSISHANIVDQLSALLYASGTVHDNEDIVGLEFSFYPSGGIYPVKIKIKKHQEVDLVQHN